MPDLVAVDTLRPADAKEQPITTPPDRPPVLRALLAQAVLLGLWLLAFLSARLLEYAPHASLWFPPAAVTFAGFLVLGWRALPALLLGCAAATMITASDDAIVLTAAGLVASALVFAATHCASIGLVAVLVRHALLRPDAARSLLRPVTAFLLGGSVGAVLAAAAGAVGLGMTGMIDPGEVGALIVPWAIGDYAGLVSLGPLLGVLLLHVCQRPPLPQSVGRFAGHAAPGVADTQAFASKLAILLGVTALVLTAAALLPGQPAIVFTLFLAIIVQTWIVHTQRTLQALYSIAAFSLLLVVLTPALGLAEHALALQFAMIALAANSYFGIAVPDLYADNARLRRLMSHDPLTGAWTRSFFIDEARAGLQRAIAHGEPAALVMIDLDELKLINDLHGHAAGDRALALLVERCSMALGERQIIGRLSGDEFCVFLPGADRLAAMRQVAAMREALQSVPPGRLPHPLQASFGIAVLERHDDSYESLLSRADQAMYEAKHSGRRDAPPRVPPR